MRKWFEWILLSVCIIASVTSVAMVAFRSDGIEVPKGHYAWGDYRVPVYGKSTIQSKEDSVLAMKSERANLLLVKLPAATHDKMRKGDLAEMFRVGGFRKPYVARFISPKGIRFAYELRESDGRVSVSGIMNAEEHSFKFKCDGDTRVTVFNILVNIEERLYIDPSEVNGAKS